MAHSEAQGSSLAFGDSAHVLDDVPDGAKGSRARQHIPKLTPLQPPETLADAWLPDLSERGFGFLGCFFLAAAGIALTLPVAPIAYLTLAPAGITLIGCQLVPKIDRAAKGLALLSACAVGAAFAATTTAIGLPLFALGVALAWGAKKTEHHHQETLALREAAWHSELRVIERDLQPRAKEREARSPVSQEEPENALPTDKNWQKSTTQDRDRSFHER